MGHNLDEDGEHIIKGDSWETKIFDTKNLKDEINWLSEGAVTKPTIQGDCGACYAFAAAGALEGANKIKNGQLVDLSIQQLIDCTHDYGNYGCEGGYIDYAYDYGMEHPLIEDTIYPYV